MATIRLTQLDGSLPNLALMKLAAWHKQRGDDIHFYKGADGAERHLDEPHYDRIYASAIFGFTKPLLERFQSQFPDAVVGGTGTPSTRTVEELIGQDFEQYDYSIAPKFTGSLGFTQRGCRLRCKFCCVPQKEGKPKSVNSIIHGIWRGQPHPKNIHLLDNDFFGQPREAWEARIAEISDGGFKVCFNQGLNVRLINAEAAAALATIEYRDDGFQRRRLYTAWDNFKDEPIFMRGVDTLEKAGIPPSHLMAYMLVGFDKTETWDRILRRFDMMVARGIRPYPMVYGEKKRQVPIGASNLDIAHKTLGEFQRWANTGLYRAIPFEQYDITRKGPQGPRSGQSDLFEPPH